MCHVYVVFFFSSRRRHTRYIGDWSSDVCSSDLPSLFILPISRCSSAPAFYTDQFSLRQRPHFLYCPFLVAAAPPLFILTGSAMNFLLPRSPCGSAPAFYTAHLSLRQRPRFLYCPFLVAAAPPLFILPISRCGSPPAFYTDQLSLRQHPRFFYCPILDAAAPPLFILPATPRAFLLPASP